MLKNGGSKMFYKITFEVDTGVNYEEDVALVFARNVDEAKEKLNKFINAIDSETCIHEFINVEFFEGSIFTGRHGCNG
jgi:hypothetical protein